MNVRYGTINVQMLIKSNKQLSNFWGKNLLETFLFNKTTKNILSYDIPYETITCDDRDSPWTNNNIKQLI